MTIVLLRLRPGALIPRRGPADVVSVPAGLLVMATKITIGPRAVSHPPRIVANVHVPEWSGSRAQSPSVNQSVI